MRTNVLSSATSLRTPYFSSIKIKKIKMMAKTSKAQTRHTELPQIDLINDTHDRNVCKAKLNLSI